MNSVQEQRIYVNTAVAMFSIIQWELAVLLIKRVQEPFEWCRCLPGGYLENDKPADQTVMEKLLMKVGLRNIYLEQCGTFTDPKRDPRYRAITIGYISIGEYHDIKKYSHYGEVAFRPLKKLPRMAFDHKDIIRHAYSVLRYKLMHSNIAQFFLPKYFTLQQLQQVYDTILGSVSDVRNFRNFIAKAHIVKSTKRKEENVSHRPAILYEFRYKDVKIEDYTF